MATQRVLRADEKLSGRAGGRRSLQRGPRHSHSGAREGLPEVTGSRAKKEVREQWALSLGSVGGTEYEGDEARKVEKPRAGGLTGLRSTWAFILRRDITGGFGAGEGQDLTWVEWIVLAHCVDIN